MRAGLYIHFPFCRAKCPYCHFYSLVDGPHLTLQWWEGLKKETERHVKENLTIETVYIGGGTPSLLQPDDLRAIRELLDGRFWLKAGEFTLEANPDIEDDSIVPGWREAGVTRLSIGVQSFDNSILGALGRAYWADRAIDFYETCRKAEFDSINIDLMTGVPGETRKTVEKNLEETVRLAPEHVSLYILENVEGLPFEKVLKDHPVNEDEAADHYRMYQEGLNSAGLRQYEISNFARPGKECIHNLRYWRYDPFLGLGPSACSHIGNKRWCNRRDLHEWARALRLGRAHFEEMVELTPEMSAKEALVFGLRLVDGVDLRALGECYRVDIESRFAREIGELVEEGWLVRDAGTIRIPPDRFLVSNHVFSRFV